MTAEPDLQPEGAMTREPYWQNVYERGVGNMWFDRSHCAKVGTWPGMDEILGPRIAMVKVTPKPGAKP